MDNTVHACIINKGEFSVEFVGVISGDSVI